MITWRRTRRDKKNKDTITTGLSVAIGGSLKIMNRSTLEKREKLSGNLAQSSAGQIHLGNQELTTSTWEIKLTRTEDQIKTRGTDRSNPSKQQMTSVSAYEETNERNQWQHTGIETIPCIVRAAAAPRSNKNKPRTRNDQPYLGD